MAGGAGEGQDGEEVGGRDAGVRRALSSCGVT